MTLKGARYPLVFQYALFFWQDKVKTPREMPSSPAAKRSPVKRQSPKRSPRRSPRRSPKRSPRRSPNQSPRKTIQQYMEYSSYMKKAAKAFDVWAKQNGGLVDFNAFIRNLPIEFRRLHKELYHRDLTHSDIISWSGRSPW